MLYAPSTATIRNSLVERNHVWGIGVLGSSATIESTLIRATLPNDEGWFGDGIFVMSAGDTRPAVVSLSSVVIESSARAGLSNFGGHVDMADTTIQCSAFDIEGEPFGEKPFVFNDLGGNLCGCPEANRACEVVSANLEPPPLP
jgi:hypothetical protein